MPHPKFWHYHREIYDNELLKLDKDLIALIIADPSSEKAIEFDRKVKTLVEQKLLDKNIKNK